MTTPELIETQSIRALAADGSGGAPVSEVDGRGCAISGATPAALEAFERALDASSAGAVARGAARHALQQAPAFVMAHVLQAWLLLSSRDPRRVRLARPVLARAAGLPANVRERLHLAAIAAALDDDYEAREGAPRAMCCVLIRAMRWRCKWRIRSTTSPATSGACTTACSGAAGVVARPARLPCACSPCTPSAWRNAASTRAPSELPAKRSALNPVNARAHHVMAHVFEMTDRADAGMRWMNEHMPGWAATRSSPRIAGGTWRCSICRTGQPDRALALYDRHVRAGHSTEVVGPDRCLRAAVAHRAARRPRRDALGRARRRLGAAHRRRLLQLQRPARDAGIRRRARLARARSASSARCAKPPRCRRATARPRDCSASRLPRADRIRARQRRARDQRCSPACRRSRIDSVAAMRSATCCT